MKTSKIESYIVRIYCRDKKDLAGITGMVEVVETGQVRKFVDLEELKAVLCRKTGKEKESTGSKDRGGRRRKRTD